MQLFKIYIQIKNNIKVLRETEGVCPITMW